MSIEFSCKCGKDFKVPDEQAGLLSRCPICKTVFKIPVNLKEISYAQLRNTAEILVTKKELDVWEPDEVYSAPKTPSKQIKKLPNKTKKSLTRSGFRRKVFLSPRRKSKSSLMMIFGSLFLMGGISIGFFSFAMNTSVSTGYSTVYVRKNGMSLGSIDNTFVGSYDKKDFLIVEDRVHNIGLMARQQNYFTVSMVLFVTGVVLLVVNSKSK